MLIFAHRAKDVGLLGFINTTEPVGLSYKEIEAGVAVCYTSLCELIAVIEKIGYSQFNQ